MTDILLVGSGGREHALALKISQSSGVGKIYASPGNPGMHYMGVECLPYKAIQIPELAAFAEKNHCFTVVGPGDPLAEGIVDVFDGRDLPIFGPTAAAARLESSKAYAKGVMDRGGVPTARYCPFTDRDKARDYAQKNYDSGIVVKASGLALGKGAIVCDTIEEAYDAIDRMLVKKEFGKAGEVVVVEQRLRGPEVSAMALVDSETIMHFPLAQDYKPQLNGDKGPNTGGMGSYSPVPIASDDDIDGICEAVSSTMLAMEDEDPFTGVAYGGFMLTSDGPKVLEYNVRFGDPETQPLMMRTKSDMLEVLMACAENRLCGDLDIDPRAAVCVVLASRGYPGKPDTGHPITGIDEAKSILGPGGEVFHAGTKLVDGVLVNSGGRVLGVTALGDTIEKAADLAYAAAERINFEGKYMRTDIGRKVLERGRA